MKQTGTITAPFLEGFYGDAISHESRFAIWTKHNRAHVWCSSIEAATKSIQPDRDSYFTMAVYPRGITKRTQDSTLGIFGVWLDIDCEKDNGERNYFPSVNEAIDWVSDSLAGYWTWIVHSGGGLHVYLMFDEPFWIESDEDRYRARHVVKAFHRWADERCPHTIDSLIDLSRVMRLPGTINTRTGGLCHIVEESQKVISFTDLEDFLPDVELDDERTVSAIDGEVNISELKRQLQLLQESDSTFDSTWRRARRLKDSSPSGYCMSLANLLCASGFHDGQIIAALRLWRDAQTDAKEKPDSWYLSTVTRARANTKGEVVGNKVTAALEEDDPASHLDGISAVLNKKVARIEKRIIPEFKGQKEKSSYVFHFDDGGTLLIPDTDTLMRQERMRAIAFEEAGVLVRRLKSNKWDDFLALVLSSRTDVLEAEEGNRAFNILNELHHFVEKKRDLSNIVTSLGDMTSTSLYEEDGVVYFKWELFKRHLSASGYQLPNAGMAKLLHDLGCLRRQFATHHRPRLWSVPPKEESQDDTQN
jgi:hypothetical protein